MTTLLRYWTRTGTLVGGCTSLFTSCTTSGPGPDCCPCLGFGICYRFATAPSLCLLIVLTLSSSTVCPLRRTPRRNTPAPNAAPREPHPLGGCNAATRGPARLPGAEHAHAPGGAPYRLRSEHRWPGIPPVAGWPHQRMASATAPRRPPRSRFRRCRRTLAAQRTTCGRSRGTDTACLLTRAAIHAALAASCHCIDSLQMMMACLTCGDF